MNTISIIIPVYKVEKYIKRCLNSVIQQTYPAELIECIIVNDCTPDNSMQIVQNFINSYSGKISVKIINHEKNRGLSAARNSGIDAATGYYLLFIDSDDYITTDCVTTLINGIENHGTDMAVGNIYIQASQNFHHSADKSFIINGQENVEKDRLCLNSAAFACNRLVKRDMIVNNQIYFEPSIIYEDILWNLQLSKHATSVVYLSNCTYNYEQNEGSILESAKIDKSPAAKAFYTILKKSIKMTNTKCIIEYHLFSLHFALELLDCIHNYNVPNITMKDFRPLRSALMRQARSISLLCFIVSLIMYKPFWYIFNTRIFKNHRVDIRFRLRDIMNKKRTTR